MKAFRDLNVGDPVWITMYDGNSTDEIPWFDKLTITDITETIVGSLFITDSGFTFSVRENSLDHTSVCDYDHVYSDFEEFRSHASETVDRLQKVLDDSKNRLEDILNK